MPKPVTGPECATPLRLYGRDAQCECPERHTYRVRASRRKCPICGERMMTFGLTDPKWIIYRLIYFLCPCGHVEQDSRLLVNPNGPGRYGGQRWSPRTGRLLSGG